MSETKSTFGDRLGFYFFAWITTFMGATILSGLDVEFVEQGFIAVFVNLFSNLMITSVFFVAIIIAIELLFT